MMMHASKSAPFSGGVEGTTWEGGPGNIPAVLPWIIEGMFTGRSHGVEVTGTNLDHVRIPSTICRPRYPPPPVSDPGSSDVDANSPPTSSRPTSTTSTFTYLFIHLPSTCPDETHFRAVALSSASITHESHPSLVCAKPTNTVNNTAASNPGPEPIRDRLPTTPRAHT